MFNVLQILNLPFQMFLKSAYSKNNGKHAGMSGTLHNLNPQSTREEPKMFLNLSKCSSGSRDPTFSQALLYGGCYNPTTIPDPNPKPLSSPGV